MKKLLLTLFMAAALCAIPWRIVAQPIQMGDAVVTCSGVSRNPGDPVLALVRLQNANTAPLNTNWATTIVHDPSWNTTNLGDIFGIALDPSGNIYVTATSCYYGQYYGTTDVFGPAGPGGIYRIDGVTGAITTFATLPNDPASKPALGNICYDADHNQFFVTNLEDGKIYRLSSAGATLQVYDPFGADPGIGISPGFCPRGERLWGVAYRNNRVYFGRWREDAGSQNAAVSNEIHSVGLTLAGAFTGGTSLEITIPPRPGTIYSNPPSDIEFSTSGNMLIGERGWSSDSWPQAHEARVLEYRFSGSWVPTGHVFNVGQINTFENTQGGVDYGYRGFNKATRRTLECDSTVVTTGDALHLNWPADQIYGLQILPATGGSIANSVLIDIDGVTTSQQKEWLGDVDVYKSCEGGNDCDRLSYQLQFTGAKGQCCWDLTIVNGSTTVTWTQVKLDILTAGVQFGSNGAPAGWTVFPSPTSATYAPTSGVIPGGASGPLKFCLTAIGAPPPPPQKIQITWIGKKGETCIDTITTDCQIPPPGCAELKNVSITCKTTPPASPSYAMSFNIHNLSGFSIDFANIIVTCPGMGVTISPSTVSFPTVPPLGTSTTQNVTIFGGTPGSTICLTIRVCDKQKINCCTFDTTLRLPICADCCDSLHIRLANTKNTYNYDGSINYSTAVTAYPTNLRKFTATLINATQRTWCKGKPVLPASPIAPTFLTATLSTTLPGVFGLGTNEVSWGSLPGGAVVNNAPLSFKIKFPPLPGYKCVDTITYYIKYTYTDVNCRTCDTTACYKVIRYGVIWLPVDQVDPIKFPFGPGKDDGGGSGKTRDGDERGIQSGPDDVTKLVTIAMSSEEEGTLTIVNPAPADGEDPAAAISIVGFSLEPAVGTDLRTITDQQTGQPGLVVDRVADLNRLQQPINQGETRNFTLNYINEAGAKAFKNIIRIRYTLAGNDEDVFEATLVVYARTPEGSGGDQLETDPDIALSNVRTYGLKFTNNNHTSEKICRVVVTLGDNNDGDDIVAVGPGIDRMSFGLKAYKTTEADSRNLLLAEEPSESQAEAIALDPQEVVTPIYVTVCGGEDRSTTFSYVTYTPEGEVVSTGTVSADNPLAPGRLGVDDPSRPGIINSVECLPNPLTNVAVFNFTLARPEPKVWLTITDINGNVVATVLDGQSMIPGTHQMNFDASMLPNGVYLYTLRTATQTQTRKLSIVR